MQLTAAKNAGADVVFLPIYYQPASVILSQAKAMSYAPTFFGVDGMDGILTMPELRYLPRRGRHAPHSVLRSTPRTLRPRASSRPTPRSYGVEPNQFAADAYDGVYIVKAALEKAGCTGDMSATEICEALVERHAHPQRGRPHR